MSQQLLAFINQYRQPLLFLYVALLLATAAMFARAIRHWSAGRMQATGRGTQMNTRYALPPGVAVPAGLFALLLSLPFFIEHLGRFGLVWKENPALIPFYLLFPIMGMLLLLTGLRGWWQQWQGTDAFHLRENILRPGGLVCGDYRSGSRGNGEPVRIHLILQQVRLFGRRKQQLLENAIWSDTIEVQPKQRGDGVEIPFLFHLPGRLPPITLADGRPEWVLVREGGGLNSDIRMIKTGKQGLSAWTGKLGGKTTRPASTLLPASVRARQGQHNVWLELGATGFVIVFPWIFWFLFDGNRQPWLHLGEQLPPLLLAGLYFLIPFFTAVFALLRWAVDDADEKARWQRRLWLAYAGDLLLLLIALFWLARNGISTPDGGWFEAGFAFLAETVPRSIIGAFLWISLITPLASIRYYWLQSRQRGE